jgi:hypothetical protein
VLSNAKACANAPYNIIYTFDSSASFKVTMHSTNDGYNGGVIAGPFTASWSTNATPPSGFDSSSFKVFCVDIRHFDASPACVNVLPVNKSNTSLTNQMGLLRAGWLYDMYAPGLDSASSKNVYGAALQIAIWQAVETTRQDVTDTSSPFYVSDNGGDSTTYSDITKQANAWLKSMDHANLKGVHADLFQIATARDDFYGGQGMLRPDPTVTINRQNLVTPESPSVMLLLFGMAPAGLFLQARKLRKARIEG